MDKGHKGKKMVSVKFSKSWKTKGDSDTLETMRARYLCFGGRTRKERDEQKTDRRACVERRQLVTWLGLLEEKPLIQIPQSWLAKRYCKFKDLSFKVNLELNLEWNPYHSISQCRPSVSFMTSLCVWECITSIFGSMCVFVWNWARAWVLCSCLQCSLDRAQGEPGDQMWPHGWPHGTSKPWKVAQVTLSSFQEAVTVICCHAPGKHSSFLTSSSSSWCLSELAALGGSGNLRRNWIIGGYAFEGNTWCLVLSSLFLFTKK